MTWSHTTAWILGGGHVPLPFTGYGWPLVLAPITWFTGPSSLSALHVVLPLQVAFLLPLGGLQVAVRKDRTSAVVLAPYTAWVIFYDLPWTYRLWRLNRST